MSKNSGVWLRRARLLLLLPLLLMLWAGIDLAYVSIGVEEDYAAPAQAIIVLGCPSYEGNIPSNQYSACVRVRAHHAADLWKRGLATNIIPSGGMTGPPPSEAEAMAQVMRADGVPDANIFIEDHAGDTVGNIIYSRAIMRAHGWQTAILVTEPHHIRRAMTIAGDGGLHVVASPAMASPSWHTPDARRQNIVNDTRSLMIYQWSRLFGLQF